MRMPPCLLAALYVRHNYAVVNMYALGVCVCVCVSMLHSGIGPSCRSRDMSSSSSSSSHRVLCVRGGVGTEKLFLLSLFSLLFLIAMQIQSHQRGGQTQQQPGSTTTTTTKITRTSPEKEGETCLLYFTAEAYRSHSLSWGTV